LSLTSVSSEPPEKGMYSAVLFKQNSNGIYPEQDIFISIKDKSKICAVHWKVIQQYLHE